MTVPAKRLEDGREYTRAGGLCVCGAVRRLLR